MAEPVEQLAAPAPGRPERPATLAADGRRRALAHARTCYDHLAGAVGVAITHAMTARGLLDRTHGLRLTAEGEARPGAAGVALPPGGRRPAVRPCPDRTERRPHLAGAVGAALCRHALAEGWVTRIGATRAVAVTPAGRHALHTTPGLPDEVLGPR